MTYLIPCTNTRYPFLVLLDDIIYIYRVRCVQLYMYHNVFVCACRVAVSVQARATASRPGDTTQSRAAEVSQLTLWQLYQEYSTNCFSTDLNTCAVAHVVIDIECVTLAFPACGFVDICYDVISSRVHRQLIEEQRHQEEETRRHRAEVIAKHRETRARVIQELLQTEKDYLHSISLCHDVFFNEEVTARVCTSSHNAQTGILTVLLWYSRLYRPVSPLHVVSGSCRNVCSLLVWTWSCCLVTSTL